MVTVNDICKLLEAFAPSGSAFDFDNCGLLVGSGAAQVRKVLFALEVNTQVIAEAVRLGAELIVTHHPLIFHKEKTVTDATYQGKLLLQLIGNRIALYSAHTSLDGAEGGCNDVLCDMLGMQQVRGLDHMCNYQGKDYYCGRIGVLQPALTVKMLAHKAGKLLESGQVSMIHPNKQVHNLAVCSGAGGDCIKDCIAQGADCLLTGELGYHDGLALWEAGVGAVQCGHYETEVPVLDALIVYLQKHINVLQYDVALVKTEIITNPYIES